MPPPDEQHGNTEEDRLRDLVGRKRRLKTQITKAKVFISSNVSDARPVNAEAGEEVKNSLDLVVKCHEELLDVLLALSDINSDKYEAELDEISRDSYVSDVVIKTKDFLNLCRQDSFSEPSSADRNVGATLPSSQINRDMQQQLQRVSIPTFKGNKADYPLFRETFDQCVDKVDCSDSYKLLQLRQCLEGEALKSIEGFPASKLGYKAAKNRLQDKYGGKRRTVLLHLDSIRQMKPVNFGDLHSIEDFADKLELSIITMREAGRVEEFEDNSMFYSVAKSKLSSISIAHFKRWALSAHKPENLVSLHVWLAQEVRFRIEAQEEAEGLSSEKVFSQNKYTKPSHKTRTFAAQKYYEHNNNNSLKCFVCGNSHRLLDCPDFIAMSVPQRWHVAKDNNLCFRCLKGSHQGRHCNSSRVCGIDDCLRTHHNMLHGGGYAPKGPMMMYCPPTEHFYSTHHREPVNFDETHRRSNYNYYQAPVMTSHLQHSQDIRKLEHVKQSNEPTCIQAHTHTSSGQSDTESYAFRTIPVILRNGNRSLTANVLLHECSTDTYLDDLVSDQLGLDGNLAQLDVSVLGGQSNRLDTKQVQLTMESLDGRFSTRLNAFTIGNVTGNMACVDWSKHASQWPHLSGINFPKIENLNRIHMLIGLNVPDVHRSITEIAGRRNEPVARLTPLGWTCIGSLRGQEQNSQVNYRRTFFVKNDTNQLLRTMWELEMRGVRDNLNDMTISDKKLFNKIARSIKLDGRYSVDIPWKDCEPNLKNNFEIAKSRLYNLEQSLSKRPAVASEYCRIIKDHINKGYVREVVTQAFELNQVWYLPHFPVVRMDKATTKVRLVMDAAAKFEGKSINDCIHPGPKLHRELSDVLLRFRNRPIALAADITEMFLQIEMTSRDRMYHRFLWRDLNTSQRCREYEYQRLVFRNTSSPFLSQLVIREHALAHRNDFEIGSKSVLDSMYVDDLLDSVDTIAEAVELRRQVSSLLTLGGFEIRKWLSNETEVLLDIPIKDRIQQFSLEDKIGLPSTKSLGILWKADSDNFTFEVNFISANPVLTKRSVVSMTAKLFDPLNLLAPFTIRAKIGIQQTWVRGLDWDQPLPSDLAQSWSDWLHELGNISDVNITRCLVNKDARVIKRTVHSVVDASELAYSAACYLVAEYVDGTLSSNLVVAKTRVAPLKAISIPKLELSGAVLGLRLAQTVCRVLEISNTDVVYWTDSQNVLFWIRGESRKYKPFVSHRVGEIHLFSDPEQWRYVPSKLNSADLATRGVSVHSLSDCTLWWHGPPFCSQNVTSWPCQSIEMPLSDEAGLEIRSSASKQATFVTHVPILDRLEPSRFSSWSRLNRLTGWVFRFIHNVRKPKSDRIFSVGLSALEISEAELFWIKHAQKSAFSDEIKSIRKGGSIDSKSRLLCLLPFIDEEGILRVNGRLQRAEFLSYDSRNHIILPKKSDISRLLVKHYHELGNHGIGTSHVLADIRSKFWILRCRELIKEWKHKCAKCRLRSRKPAQQLMAPLPKSRLGMPLRAFARVAVDYGGPYLTKQGRGKVQTKRWLCLFTCLASRAVHLELSWNLDTDSFCSRRGKPIQVISDNGTNFRGAERELRELLMCLDSDKIGSTLANSGIKWQFNPPLAPHFGGVFEILIKSAKKAIGAILGHADISDEELLTAITHTEGLLNSRPVCYVSDSVGDSILTPNHFLFGQCGGQLAPECVNDIRFNPRRRWRRIQDLIKHFWFRWIREFLPTLNTRQKWTSENKNISVNDIVLVVDPQTPRGKWPLGKVTKTFPGSDGNVRVVEVKVGDNTITRSISRLCPLEA